MSWDCPSCKLKNAAGAARCYSCNTLAPQKPATDGRVIAGAAVAGGVLAAVVAGPVIGLVGAGAAGKPISFAQMRFAHIC